MTCLLLDLAQGGLEVAFAGIDLSLGKAPIVVARPMDNRYLDRCIAVSRPPAPPENTSGRADVPSLHDCIHTRNGGRSSFPQVSGNEERASPAATS